MPPANEDLAEFVRLADELLVQAAELREDWERLAALLDPAAPAETNKALAPPEPQEKADPRMLIALDMALSGRTREETDSYLRTTFGPAGTSEIVAKVYDSVE